MKRLFAPIEKMETQDDGTLKVWGYASTGAMDDDGETILPDAIKAALPDYLKWGAVREMHQPKAVGTAIEANVQEDGRTWFGAHVVDPIAVKKVQNKVLKGFSVGGRVTARDDVEKTTITGINLIEVSLVDRPANPECEIVIAKAAAADAAYVEDLAEVLTAGKVDVRQLLKAAHALAAKPATLSEPLAKGLYDVRDFAQALEALAWVCMSSQWDFDAEGDGSPVPANLRAWLKDGVVIFQAMAEEESRELVEALQDQAGEEIAMAAGQSKEQDMQLNLAKVGAKFSKETMDKMQKLSDHHDKMVKCAKDLHGMTKEACDMMKAMMTADEGAKDKPETEDDDGNTDGKTKAATAIAAAGQDDLQNQASQLADIIKSAVAAAVAPIHADLDAIKRQPVGGVPFASQAAAEAVLKSRGLTAVDRNVDASQDPNAPVIEPVRTGTGKIDEGATVTKALMLRPMIRRAG
jgi:hypothetical protein